MIIDPPSPFAPLSEWERFREDMEATLSNDPENADLLEYLTLAKATVASLQIK